MRHRDRIQCIYLNTIQKVYVVSCVYRLKAIFNKLCHYSVTFAISISTITKSLKEKSTVLSTNVYSLRVSSTAFVLSSSCSFSFSTITTLTLCFIPRSSSFRKETTQPHNYNYLKVEVQNNCNHITS